mgnify:FL=1
MGQKKNVDMSMDETEVKVVEAATENVTEDGAEKKPAKKTSLKKKIRSQKY